MGWRKQTEPQMTEVKPNQLPQVPPMSSGLKSLKVPEPSKPKEVWEVVSKIPTEEIRRVQLEDGTIVNYITKEEVELRKLTQEVNNAWPI